MLDLYTPAFSICTVPTATGPYFCLQPLSPWAMTMVKIWSSICDGACINGFGKLRTEQTLHWTYIPLPQLSSKPLGPTHTYFITKRPSDSYNQLPHLFILISSAAFIAYILSACPCEIVHRAKAWLKHRAEAIAINVISTVAIPYVLTVLHYESLHWSLQHKNVH